ncbi:hypothetical protein FRB97_008538 [Tulasnella sp. 331]|nr:hypothetical protein FRB97_008538 [Tulasnella sp. 331]
MLSNEARKNEGGKAEDVVATQYGSDAIIVQADAKPLLIPLREATPSAVEVLVPTVNQGVACRLGDVETNQLPEDVFQDIFYIIYKPGVLILEGTLKLATGSHIWWMLTRARADYLPVGSPSWPRLLAVAHPGAEKARLLYVKPEIAAIPKRVENITVLEGEDCSREAVLAGLKNAERIRFACHGNLDPWEPFKSRFSLWSCEAPLTLLDIISTGVLKVELAALSACHSAAGDKATPDETIRLTTDLLFAGFRTAVGTTWAMVDEDRPTVAEEFYKYMLRNGPEAVECRDTAKARSIGLKELRRRRVRVGGVVREMDQLLFTTGSNLSTPDSGVVWLNSSRALEY